MRNLTVFSILLLLCFSISCSNQRESDYPAKISDKIDTYLTKAMELHNIPGLALAVVEGDQVVYERYLGKSSLEKDAPVDTTTLFRVFSATKLITSTAVFQLIQIGKLSLEDSISTYLDDLPAQWQQIKIKHLLSHASGLPDLIRHESTLSDKALMEKLSADKMDFITGSQFRYNQTNYWLLALIIEKITGMTFDEFVFKNQFDHSNDGVLFSSNSLEPIPNRAVRYFYNSKTHAFEKDTNNSGQRGHSGNGLNITLREFIEWNRKLDNHELLSSEMKSKMWEPFKFTNQKDHFLHGWGNYPVNELDSYGFSGGNLAAFRKFVNHQTTIILLSNGYEIPAYDIIINDVARIAIPELTAKKRTLEEEVMSLAINRRFNEATQAFMKLKEENPSTDFDNLKWNINSLGNSYLYRENNIEKALEVFKINAEANPSWWVSMASLAETYELKNDRLHAIENYQKAIRLNEGNAWNYNEQMKNKIEELQNN
ncbi:serine hydrolase domain-containing protein [Sunxiuqinia elliptica]|uniref:CubicO group peptidase (Beta-lactamase class C family) n=1 Tax=Sunxiuqinia elliptica TaxID=655355 RepID=A0A4R6GSB7_9BACT|nr:serine hydrolase domain-containing protein [Sunxiuqinia elliptica]TDN97630.1 CubicO group peptidase (beta-lactamase class C family) [Sunxiuqinia elliptica]TDO66986.1 CubicO group peptidase (beta-lactamase class C family) [Sunxiuqinia elliptica]